jgi:ATP-dependent DNA helicase DinG
VGDRIGKHLWDARRSVIGLGASVRVGGDFEFMRGRLGARRERVPALAMHSATDYTDRILVYLPTDMPEPNERNKYQRGIEKGIIELASVTPGRMLVLFTSFTQLRQASQNVVARLGLGNIAVFDQSDGTSQSALIEGLMSVERGVLLGSRQFWDEVELPPGSLDALVIVRLPFAVPSDPLFASRSEQYSNSFNGYTLPDSLITFRQAFEQILRGASRHNRRGVVALFDKRMTSKEYGQAFLDSLPPSKIQRGLLTELSTTARSWYGSK